MLLKVLITCSLFGNDLIQKQGIRDTFPDCTNSLLRVEIVTNLTADRLKLHNQPSDSSINRNKTKRGVTEISVIAPAKNNLTNPGDE